MKIRLDFVTNSSSSSFTILKVYLSPYQIRRIYNHADDCTGFLDFAWIISEDEDTISGSTFMDNFDMEEFLEKIGVNMDKVKWGE